MLVFRKRANISIIPMVQGQEEKQYMIALTRIPGVGHGNAKKLIAYCGGPKEVFSKSHGALGKIPGIGEVVSSAIVKSNVLKDAEREVIACEKQGIGILTFLDKDFPHRLNHCGDAPILLYMKGEADVLAMYTGKYQEALAQLKRLGDGLERGDAYRDGQARVKVT